MPVSRYLLNITLKKCLYPLSLPLPLTPNILLILLSYHCYFQEHMKHCSLLIRIYAYYYYIYNKNFQREISLLYQSSSRVSQRQRWNTTCDLVIKSWVKIGQKMRLGVKIGSLKNSEGIFYNLLTTQLRKNWKLTSRKKVDYQLTFSIKKLIFFFLLVGLSWFLHHDFPHKISVILVPNTW